MTKTLYGACGNDGCLDCTPTFITEGDGDDWETYEIEFSFSRSKK